MNENPNILKALPDSANEQIEGMLPPVDVPKDYTFRTTLTEKGKLAPVGWIWLELRIQNYDSGKKASTGRFAAPMPKGLTKEQKEYFAARMRQKIKEQTGR